MTRRTPRVPGEPAQAVADATDQPTTEAPGTTETASQQSALPHPASIDPTKIKSAVLTSQGWICPAPQAAAK